MTKNLIIVESPAKARTLGKYLGSDFKALASYGHVRDLLPKSGAVETDNNFEMHYTLVERNKKHVDEIAREARKAEALYLATDPDREGEAISWHLCEILNERGVLKGKPVYRVVFHEITKRAIQEAVDNPRELSIPLINAQQARRALDYLVGFNLSPLLWKKVRRGLSAGRVQSPALRLICEREDEIDKFVKREYWSIESDLEAEKRPFVARLTHYDGRKLDQFDINNEARAAEVKTRLNDAAGGELNVIEVERKQRKRNPAPPFTTSTLQQEASRKLGFTAQRTMRVAQQLYEGVEIDGTGVGLITYMRTDSVVLGRDAVEEMRNYIGERYGSDYVPPAPRTFKNQSKNAQEAHEAIRPTSIERSPDKVKRYVGGDQLRLYDLIWKRALASQMAHAVLDQVAVDLSPGDGSDRFRANGSTITFPGFIRVYQEGRDEDAPKADSGDDESQLPPLEKGQKVRLNEIRAEQHFTEPPPRYTEASLVKTLEAHGIGRPSTYANIITTLVQREYVELESRRFFPTDVGKVVNRFLTEHFTRYVDYDFTARLEDELDEVSRGEKDWLPVMQEFWSDFNPLVKNKEETVSRDEAVQAREIGKDPTSGKPITVRMGRYGPFVQIGTREDEDKPRFAGLRPGQKMDTIEMDEALKLFELPRVLGETADGEEVSANIGRFGPYVRYASKFVSLKKEDPYEVTLETALELIEEKKKFDANRIIHDYVDDGIQVLNGRFGPYITDGERNAKIPKDTDPKSLDVDTCKTLLKDAPLRKKRASKKKTATKKVAASKATRKVTRKKSTKKKTTRKSASKKATRKKASAKPSLVGNAVSADTIASGDD
ncbi:MAG: DNA topoisomerase 1 [marine bacterium B5-7]|nr:MAG: DNA topoisomerase 1 [marine bacterium B5-7]